MLSNEIIISDRTVAIQSTYKEQNRIFANVGLVINDSTWSWFKCWFYSDRTEIETEKYLKASKNEICALKSFLLSNAESIKTFAESL